MYESVLIVAVMAWACGMIWSSHSYFGAACESQQGLTLFPTLHVVWEILLIWSHFIAYICALVWTAEPGRDVQQYTWWRVNILYAAVVWLWPRSHHLGSCDQRPSELRLYHLFKFLLPGRDSSSLSCRSAGASGCSDLLSSHLLSNWIQNLYVIYWNVLI